MIITVPALLKAEKARVETGSHDNFVLLWFLQKTLSFTEEFSSNLRINYNGR